MLRTSVKKLTLLLLLNLASFFAIVGIFEVCFRFWPKPIDLTQSLPPMHEERYCTKIPSTQNTTAALRISTLEMPRFEPAPYLENPGQVSDRHLKFPFFTLGPHSLLLARPNFDGYSEARRLDGELVYRSRVRTDQFGFRISTSKTDQRQRPKHFILMGCSFVWGEGLDDDETLAYQLNSLSSSYSVYNRGFPGQGPIEVLMQMRRDDFFKNIPQERGIAAYIFIPNHIDRTIGTMGIFRSWGRNLHAFHFEGESLVIKSTFPEEEPLRYRLLKGLSHSATLRKFGIDLPLRHERHYYLFSKVIRELKQEYLRQRPQGRFVFVFLPPHAPHIELLEKYLEQDGIEYLPYHWGPTFDQLTPAQTAIPYDGHPTKEYNRLLAQLLALDLELRFNRP